MRLCLQSLDILLGIVLNGKFCSYFWCLCEHHLLRKYSVCVKVTDSSTKYIQLRVKFFSFPWSILDWDDRAVVPGSHCADY